MQVAISEIETFRQGSASCWLGERDSRPKLFGTRLQAVLARHWAGPWLLAGGGLLWEIVGICPLVLPDLPACPACPSRCCSQGGGGGGGVGVVVFAVVVGLPAVLVGRCMSWHGALQCRNPSPPASLELRPVDAHQVPGWAACQPAKGTQHATSASSWHANVGPGPFFSCT